MVRAAQGVHGAAVNVMDYNMPTQIIMTEVREGGRVLPDMMICRTAPLEIGIHWGDCLVDDSLGCRFAKSYGEARCICTHPNWYEFIKQ